MTVLKHELKLGATSLMIWTAAVAILLAACVFIYPEMGDQMGSVGDTFAQMGGFSEAFGMDKINFGEFLGFFAIECGNVLGLGGALFAALLGVSALAKEEKEHTAEFLLTHPRGRAGIVTEKLMSLFAQIIIFNGLIIAISAVSIKIIGETPDFKTCALLFLSYFIMQIEIACICFGISAFLHRGGLGMGLGIAIILYFLNIIANLTSEAEVLKYITPFGYADGANIVADVSLEGKYIAVGMAIAVISVMLGFCKYVKKDIAS